MWDVDGNEMFDFHNGFGSMVQGHAPPGHRGRRPRALRARHALRGADRGRVVVAEELQRRWGLPRWRYTNSGSEATMDAIRIARAYTGRDTVLKIFGSYHGHHDTVMVSIGVAYDAIGDHDHPASLPYGAGIPQSTVDEVFAVHFNDADSMERRIVELDREGRKPACVIMEAAMMNLGVVLPEPGYLEAVRDITRRHGVVLIFDEVKTGLCIAPGGATERFGVTPDLVTLAKALGGGLPSGAIGGSAEVMSVVEDGSVYQVGTYNGNPLSMAATRANLLEVLTPDAYARLDALNARLLAGCTRVLDQYGLPGYAVGDRLEGLRDLRDREGHRLREVQVPPGRRAGRPGLAVQHEPRGLHDARARGGVDALGDAHRRGRRPLRRGLRGDGAGPHGLSAGALRRQRGLRPLVLLQLAALLVLGAATVARLHVFAEIDERANYDYVQALAEDGRLPRPTDLISREALAIDDGTWPRPSPRDPARIGLTGRSYEAIQPPASYALDVPAFLVAGDHRVKVRVVRVFDLLVLAAGVALLWRLAVALAPTREAALGGLSAALAVLLWPGMVVRTVAIGSVALEVALTAAFLLAAWRADRSGRAGPLVLAAVLLGLGLLTKLTLVDLAPVLVLVLARRLRADRSRRAVATAAACLALPVVVLAPWLALNQARYDAPTVNIQGQPGVVQPIGSSGGGAASATWAPSTAGCWTACCPRSSAPSSASGGSARRSTRWRSRCWRRRWRCCWPAVATSPPGCSCSRSSRASCSSTRRTC